MRLLMFYPSYMDVFGKELPHEVDLTTFHLPKI